MISTITSVGSGLIFELGLFAAVVFMVFGIDDVIVDIMHFWGATKRAATQLPEDADIDMRFAVFVPAWREEAVIAEMLKRLLSVWARSDIRVYVGVYRNDEPTIRAVAGASGDARVQMVFNDLPGPTTKGACLNQLWQALLADIDTGRFCADAVLLHDAEDVVDVDALSALCAALRTADYAQLPVVPLAERGLNWIGRHYGDEFAESHAKELPLRVAIGAAMPLAGVGCAIRIASLCAINTDDGPFAAGSLTEDYEMGLRLHAAGAKAAFVERRASTGRLIATRSLFPHDISDAVRQKTRWLRGNALDAWDRLGWPTPQGARLSQRVAAIWMLWRDRRAIVAALAIFAGYCAILLSIGCLALAQFTESAPFLPYFASLYWIGAFNLGLLFWRLGMRAGFSARRYGWQQGILAIARQPVSNIILVMTAWRALVSYWRDWRVAVPAWDKTAHRFPHRLVNEQ